MPGPVWVRDNVYGYWDALQKPPGWPSGMAWPPPVPSGGQIPPPPDGWNEELHGPWYDTFIGLDTARNAAERTAALQPTAPVVADGTEGVSQVPNEAPAVPYTPPVQGQAPPAAAPAVQAAAPAAPPSAPVAQAAPAAAPSREMSKPPAYLTAQPAYKNDSDRFGGNVVSWSAPPEGTDPRAASFSVTYSLDAEPGSTKNTVTVTYAHSGVGGSGPLVVTGSRASLADQSGTEKYLRAQQAEEARIGGLLKSGQLQGVELETLIKQKDQLELDRNERDGKGRLTDKQVIEAGNQTRGTEASVAQAATGQANSNLAHTQAVAQILYQRGYTWNQAMQMATDIANKQAAIDQSNTNLVVNAANAIYGNDVTQRGQDVTLANNRLNAANSGYSDDMKNAMTLNETLQPGSSKGVNAMVGMMGIRYLTAKKWGGLDPIERAKPPSTITQLGGDGPDGKPLTPIKLPSLKTPEELANDAENMLNRGGVTGWPETSGIKPPFTIQNPAPATSRPSPSTSSRPATTAPAPSAAGDGGDVGRRPAPQAQTPSVSPQVDGLQTQQQQTPTVSPQVDGVQAPQAQEPARTKPLIRLANADGSSTFFDPADPANAQLVENINQRLATHGELPPEWSIEQYPEDTRVDARPLGQDGKPIEPAGEPVPASIPEGMSTEPVGTPVVPVPPSQRISGDTKPMVRVDLGDEVVYFDPDVNPNLQGYPTTPMPIGTPDRHVERPDGSTGVGQTYKPDDGRPEVDPTQMPPGAGLMPQGYAPASALTPVALNAVSPTDGGQAQLREMQLADEEEQRRRRRLRMPQDMFGGMVQPESYF